MTALIHDNIAPSCSTIEALYEDPDYPVTNLLTDAPADYYLCPNSTLQVDLHFPSPVIFTGIAIVNHNIPIDAAITLKLSNNNNFLSSENVVITWNELIIFQEIAKPAYKDIRLYITSTADTMQIGQLYLGSYTEISEDPYYPVERIPIETSQILLADVGQKNKVKGVLTWKISMNFPAIPLSEFKTLCAINSRNEVLVLIISTSSKEAFQGISQIDKGQEELEGVYFTLSIDQNPYEYQ